MKSLNDPSQALANGLSKIRTEFHVPDGFPPDVMALAQTAAKRVPSQHADRTAMPFVTLDPATSTDLDQAFSIEASGGDLLLHYAIADVAWFVEDGDAVDLEAWARGETLYLPDGKAGLYPPVLAEGAASLLPSGPRPAVIFTVRIAADGAVKLDGAERAIIQSRAKLAYDSVRASDVPAGFAEIARRMAAAEERRGASRVDPPEQEVEQLADGRVPACVQTAAAIRARQRRAFAGRQHGDCRRHAGAPDRAVPGDGAAGCLPRCKACAARHRLSACPGRPRPACATISEPSIRPTRNRPR